MRCSLGKLLGRIFDDGAGQISPRLIPVVDALNAAAVPKSVINWLSKPQTAQRITAIATGEVALTHEGIDELPASNGREHLRQLLVEHDILPARDRYLAAFERWTVGVLEGIEAKADRRLVASFLRWHIRPRLERQASVGELTESRYSVARAQTNIAVHFLAWLAGRDAELGSASQSDIDAWFATGPTTRLQSRCFLRWAMTTRRCTRFELPADRVAEPRPMAERDRISLLSRLLVDEDLELVDRVVGCLVLLYALPASRIHRLRLTDLHDGGPDGLMILVGADPIPVPAPLEALLSRLIEHRANLSRPSQVDTDWLFPGARPGQPIEPDQLAERLNRLGITRAARTSALNALLREVPAPVVSKVLNRRPWRMAARAKALGTDWANYAGLKARA